MTRLNIFLVLIAGGLLTTAYAAKSTQSTNYSNHKNTTDSTMNKPLKFNKEITDLKELRMLADAELNSGARVGYVGLFFSQYATQSENPLEVQKLFETEYLQKVLEKGFFSDVLSARLNILTRMLGKGMRDEAFALENQFLDDVQEYKDKINAPLVWSLYASLSGTYRTLTRHLEGKAKISAYRSTLIYLVLAKEAAKEIGRNDLALSSLNRMMDVYIELGRFDQVEKFYHEIKPLAEASDDPNKLALLNTYEKLVIEYNRLKSQGKVK